MPLCFGDEVFDSPGELAAFFFERIVAFSGRAATDASLPPKDMVLAACPEYLTLLDYLIANDFWSFYALEIMESPQLSELLHKTCEVLKNTGMSGTGRVLLFLTQLCPSCRKIVCGGRVFSDEREFGSAVTDACNSGQDGERFLFLALDCVNSGYLEVFLRLCCSENSGSVQKIRSVREKLTGSVFWEVPEVWRGLCIGYVLSGEFRFSEGDFSCSGADDFFRKISELRVTDPQKYIDLACSLKAPFRVMKTFLLNPGHQTMLDRLMADSISARFGEDEYFFRNATDFRMFADRLAAEGKLHELRALDEKYCTALGLLDLRYWKSGCRELLKHHLKGKRESILRYLFGKLKNLTGVRSDRNTGFIATEFGIINPIARREYLSPVLDPGEYVSFGTWTLHADSDRRSDILWIVLDLREHYALLLALPGLCCRSFREDGGQPSWEESDLRRWLNTEFLNEAFTEEERKWIYRGSADTDTVFCLSRKETSLIPPVAISLTPPLENRRQYYPVNRKLCIPSPRALKDNPFRCAGNDVPSPWWLRTQGPKPGMAWTVWVDGSFRVIPSGQSGILVRPAIRLAL